MVRLFVLLLLMYGSVAQAETADVPLLPDGTVDVDAVESTFSAIRPILTTGAAPLFTGSMLGQSYTARYDDSDLSEPFELTITSTGLSEHAHYLVALLLNELICVITNDLGLGDVPWHETAVPVDSGWKVQMSCSDSAD